MQTIGYARVSTSDQDLTIEQHALKASGCSVIRAEKKSGISIEGRSELAIILDFIGAGDVLVVTKLDRLARSLADLSAIVATLARKGAALRVSVILLERSKPRRARKLAAPKAPGERATRRGRRFHIVAASGVMLGALALLGLSLSHLASGVVIVTGSGERDGWLMAIGIDLGLVALELALLAAPVTARPAVARYASPAIIGTLATSAAMNAFAFASHAEGFMIYPAIGLGFAVPALVYALTKTGATIYLEK